MGLEPSWYQIWNKTGYIPKVRKIFYIKRISVLISRKVSSLACKCIFHRQEQNAEGEHHGIEF